MTLTKKDKAEIAKMIPAVWARRTSTVAAAGGPCAV